MQRVGALSGAGSQGLATLFAWPFHSRAQASCSRSGRSGLVASAVARPVATSVAVAERDSRQQEQSLESLLFSEERERRRRSLEASYDAESTPDLDVEARQQQLEQSSARPAVLDHQAEEFPSGRQSSAAPGAAATSPKRPKRGKAASSRTQPAAITAPRDAADASDHQLLHGRHRANGSCPSLAAKRAARRATGQGRVEMQALATPQPLQRRTKKQLGPAETFLNSLQDRLDRGRDGTRRASGMDAVSWYLQNIGNSHVLSRNEETQLGAIIHLGNSAHAAQKQLREQNGAEPSLQQVAHHLGLKSAATVQQRLENSRRAKDVLLQYNIKLVISVAKQFSNRGVEFPDLLPPGIAGLSRAIDRFDASKGFKFSTYAHWWIRQAISRCVQDQSRVVRLPVNVYELLGKINRVTRQLNNQPGREQPATYDEIAAALGLPVAKVIQVVKASRDTRSLDTPIDNGRPNQSGESTLLVDMIEADAIESKESAADRAVKDQVDQALKGLDLRPRNILRYRYGLHTALGGRALTLNEVGELYGLKGERVRQIEGVAMQVLKHGLKDALAKAEREQ